MFLPLVAAAQEPDAAPDSIPKNVQTIVPQDTISNAADSATFVLPADFIIATQNNVMAQTEKDIKNRRARRADICGKIRQFINAPTEKNMAIVNSVSGISLKRINVTSFDLARTGIPGQAFYDIMSNTICMNYLSLTAISVNESDMMWPTKIADTNANLPKAFLHEDDHREKESFISRMGMTVPEIFEFHVHKEVSARARELLDFRETLVEKGLRKEALSNDTYRMFHRISADAYLSYLKKHGKDLTDTISAKEMNIILNTALNMLKEEGVNDYPDDTWKAAFRDMIIAQPVYAAKGGAESYIATSPNIPKYPFLSTYLRLAPNDRDGMLSKLYTFDGVCFSERLEDRDTFLKGVTALCERYGMKKFVEKMEKENPAYDQMARKFLDDFTNKTTVMPSIALKPTATELMSKSVQNAELR